MFYPVLRGAVQKVSDTQFSHFVAPPPSLPVNYDQSHSSMFNYHYLHLSTRAKASVKNSYEPRHNREGHNRRLTVITWPVVGLPFFTAIFCTLPISNCDERT